MNLSKRGDYSKVEEKILISVVVLTYNHEKYVQEAINSILNQETSFEFEILIGDDCSKDGTQEILMDCYKRYPDTIKLVLRDKNVGVTNNLFDLLEKCSGSFIAFLEGDDFWNSSDKLQKQVDFMLKNPQFSGTAHDYIMIDNAGKNYSHRKCEGVYNWKQFKYGKLPGQTGTLCFRNFLKDGKDSYDIICRASKNIGDRTIVLLLLLHGPIYCFKEKMSTYRVFSSEDSWSRKLGKGSKEINPYFEELCYYVNLTNYAKEQWGITQSAFCNKSYCVYESLKRYLKVKNITNREIFKKCWRVYDESKILLAMCGIYLMIRDLFKKVV